jgi:hypothetical protein
MYTIGVWCQSKHVTYGMPKELDWYLLAQNNPFFLWFNPRTHILCWGTQVLKSYDLIVVKALDFKAYKFGLWNLKLKTLGPKGLGLVILFGWKIAKKWYNFSKT